MCYAFLRLVFLDNNNPILNSPFHTRQKGVFCCALKLQWHVFHLMFFIAGYYCTCAALFMGTHCDVSINPCASNPCLYGGTCIPVNDDFICQCRGLYTGQRYNVLLTVPSPHPSGVYLYQSKLAKLFICINFNVLCLQNIFYLIVIFSNVVFESVLRITTF